MVTLIDVEETPVDTIDDVDAVGTVSKHNERITASLMKLYVARVFDTERIPEHIEEGS